MSPSVAQKLAGLDARARAAGARAPKPQLRFYWMEDAERLGQTGSECIDAVREADNLVYERPYVMNIPHYRKVVPRALSELRRPQIHVV